MPQFSKVRCQAPSWRLVTSPTVCRVESPRQPAHTVHSASLLRPNQTSMLKRASRRTIDRGWYMTRGVETPTLKAAFFEAKLLQLDDLPLLLLLCHGGC